MLLKDFNTTSYYYTKDTGPNEWMAMVNFIIRAQVVIKRDEKHYTVDCIKEYHEKVGLFGADMMQCYITDFLQECRRIDEKWILVGEIEDNMRGKRLAEKPIKL
jgi:hypothetical protein